MQSLDGPIASQMTQALDQKGLKWEPVLVTDSSLTIEAAVRGGHAVTALPVFDTASPPSQLRALEPKDGFPTLAPLTLALVTPLGTISLAGQRFRELLLSELR
ncbi:LysR substrate-binding domain-containing protein [Neorhizobium petrolearium]